jgi:Holliday junction resolvase
MRRRTDNNQTEIVEILRAVGCSVAITSGLGRGFPDLVVGYRGKNYLFEIKDGNKAPSQRKLTIDEKRFHETWRGQVFVIKNINEALRTIGALG